MYVDNYNNIINKLIQAVFKKNVKINQNFVYCKIMHTNAINKLKCICGLFSLKKML